MMKHFILAISLLGTVYGGSVNLEYLQSIADKVYSLQTTWKNCIKPADLGVVKATWKVIKDSLGENAPETVGRLVFENLFKEYPYMTNFFKNYGDNADEIMANKKFMWHAKERVYVTFDKIITNLDNQNEIDSITSWIAKVHEPKGVKTADLQNLGSAILKTLEQALGNNFTPSVKNDWTTVITDLMNGIGSQIKI